MPLPSTTPQDNHAILVVVLIVTGLCIAYWRTALRVAVFILIAFAIYGLITGLHGMHV